MDRRKVQWRESFTFINSRINFCVRTEQLFYHSEMAACHCMMKRAPSAWRCGFEQRLRRVFFQNSGDDVVLTDSRSTVQRRPPQLHQGSEGDSENREFSRRLGLQKPTSKLKAGSLGYRVLCAKVEATTDERLDLLDAERVFAARESM